MVIVNISKNNSVYGFHQTMIPQMTCSKPIARKRAINASGKHPPKLILTPNIHR